MTPISSLQSATASFSTSSAISQTSGVSKESTQGSQSSSVAASTSQSFRTRLPSRKYTEPPAPRHDTEDKRRFSPEVVRSFMATIGISLVSSSNSSSAPASTTTSLPTMPPSTGTHPSTTASVTDVVTRSTLKLSSP